jgi:hypothetical protein
MRIIIETEEGKKPSVQPEPTVEAEAGAAVAPPRELAARAAEIGASSAGPAPVEMGAEGSAPFVGGPGTPETAAYDDRSPAGSTFAGAAPDFAAGALEVDEVEADTEVES